MAKSGNTMFAVLGVLTKGVYSGYDIKKHFSGSLHHFWSESYGQIYPALKELVAQGYAVEASTPIQTRGQKKYQITPEGMEHFRKWLSAPIGALNYRDELLLKVFLQPLRIKKSLEVCSNMSWVSSQMPWRFTANNSVH